MEKFERLYHEQLEIARTLKADAAIMRTNLRDKFAMAAMQGLTSNPEYCISKEDAAKYGSGDAVTAHYAYAQADAMMVARGIENPEELRQQRDELQSALKECRRVMMVEDGLNLGYGWKQFVTETVDPILAKIKGAA